MLKYLIVAIFLILITVSVIILNFYSDEYIEPFSEISIDPSRELITLHVVFRHGARTPVGTYPKDPYMNETYYPIGYGQLTKVGKQQMYQNGKWLRRRYKKFLGEIYDFEETFAQSTNLYRTIMSTGALLAGLYPPHGTLMDWNHELNWQPIPIYSTELEEDHMLYVLSKCNRHSEAWIEILTSPNTTLNSKENKQLLNELSEYTGLQFQSPFDIIRIFYMLEAQDKFGLKLPDWTEQYYPNRLRSYCERYYLYSSWTDELKRLKGGLFIGNLIKIWREKIQGTIEPAKRKLFIYGGHDLTIVPILSTLNVWQQQIPVAGIMAIFELLQDRVTGAYGVKVFQKIPDKNIESLTIPGCEDFCPLERFIQMTKNFVPTDIGRECIPKDPNFIPPTLPKTL